MLFLELSLMLVAVVAGEGEGGGEGMEGKGGGKQPARKWKTDPHLKEMNYRRRLGRRVLTNAQEAPAKGGRVVIRRRPERRPDNGQSPASLRRLTKAMSPPLPRPSPNW